MNWTADEASSESSHRLHGEDRASKDMPHECAIFTGSTGRLDESSCEWAGYQCICELGAELLPAYTRSMLSSRQTRDRNAESMRKYLMTLFCMALGLPLLLDNRVLQIGKWIVSRGTGQASAERTPAPSLQTVYCTLTVHVAWAMVIVGWGPFLWQAVVGNWDAACLGAWPNYTPIGPFGMWIVLEIAPLQHFRLAGLTVGVFTLAVCTAIVYFVLTKVYHDYTLAFGGGVQVEASDLWLHAHNLAISGVDEAPAIVYSPPLASFWVVSAGVRAYRRPNAHQVIHVHVHAEDPAQVTSVGSVQEAGRPKCC